MATIAVVDDEPGVRSVISELLTSRRHQVLEFERCDRALAALERDAPDLLLCDVTLNGESGLDLVARLRATHPERALPILMLSGMRSESDFLRGYAAGATDYLAKPFTADELLAKCQVLLARSARHGSGVPPSPDELPGSPEGLAFDRYELRSVLGRGSYGVVYHARDALTDRPVALKVLSALPASQPECRLRFMRETYALAAVRSPHVAGVLDAGTAEGRLYYAMDLVHGPTLEGRVRRDGTATEQQALSLLSGLAHALGALERADVLHRDIKPQNVVLRDGRWELPVLVDFGLAKRPFDRGLTDPQMLIGTPGYMAPEVIRGRTLDHRSDLFSAGLVARYALTGTEVFPALSGLALLQAIASRPVPLPRGISPALRELLRRLLMVERGRRTESAAALLAEVNALLPSEQHAHGPPLTSRGAPE